MTSGQLPPVMVLGCGRSGTSIFGELFNDLANYSYRSEPPFEDVLSADYSVPLAFKVPREPADIVADPGLSFPLDVLLQRQPAFKFFWIVRHPLDAICSLRIGIAKNWGHHPRPPDWREWTGRPLVEQCAHHWNHINSTGYKRVAHLATVVRFEAMIADPADFHRAISRQLGIAEDLASPGLQAWQRRVQNTNNADFVEAMTSRDYSRPDHSVRVGRWRENLSDDDIARIRPIVEATARQFGYGLEKA